MNINFRTILSTFESVEDFYDYVDSIPNMNLSTNQREILNEFSKENKSFTGASLQDIQARRNGWIDGIEKLNALPEIGAYNTGSQKIKVWSDEDGDEMDIERFRDEKPFLSKRKKVFSGVKRGLRRIYVNICENASTEASALMQKCYTLVKIVDGLEAQGIRTEVFVVVYVKNIDNDNKRDLVIQIKAKEAQEPLNTALMLQVTSSWFFRSECFKAVLSSHKDIKHSLGRSSKIIDIMDDQEKDSILIDQYECLNSFSSERFIKRITETK